MNKMAKVLGNGKWLVLIALAACSGMSQGGDGAAGSSGSAAHAGVSGVGGSRSVGAGGSAEQPNAAAGQAGETDSVAGQASEAGAGGEAGASVAGAAPTVKLILPSILLAKDFPYTPIVCANVGYFVANLTISSAAVPNGTQQQLGAAKLATSGPCAAPEFGFQYAADPLSVPDGTVKLDAHMYNSLSSGPVEVSSDEALVTIDRALPVPSLTLYDRYTLAVSCGSGKLYSGPFSAFVTVEPTITHAISVVADGNDVASAAPGMISGTFALSAGSRMVDVTATSKSGNIGHLAAPCAVNVN